MGIERLIGLFQVKNFIDKRFKKDTPSPIDEAMAVDISSEIKDCFDYFDQHSPKALGDQPIILIHGNGIEIKKVAKGKGYSIETDGVVRIVGVDTIPKLEQVEIVKKIRNITFPYAEHSSKRQKALT